MSFFDIKNWWNGKTNFCDNVILYIWGKVSSCVTLNAWHGPVLLYSCHFGFVIFFHNTDHDHRCQVRNFVANCGIGSCWSWNWPSSTTGSTSSTSSIGSTSSTVGVGGERIKSKRTGRRTKGNPAKCLDLRSLKLSHLRYCSIIITPLSILDDTVLTATEIFWLLRLCRCAPILYPVIRVLFFIVVFSIFWATE